MRKASVVLCLMLICAGAAMAQTASDQFGAATCPPGQTPAPSAATCPPGQAPAPAVCPPGMYIGAAAETGITAARECEWDNLFIWGSGGGLREDDISDSTWLGTAGFSYGMPLVPAWNLGLQFGGEARWRDNDPDYFGMIGFMQREPAGMAGWAWSLQGIYARSWLHADLWGLQPLLGFQLDETSYLAFTGLWAINDDGVDRNGITGTQELINQAWLLWGGDLAQWDTIAEFGVGYEWSNIDTVVLGLNLGWQLGSATSINIYGQYDFEDNWYAALAVAFDLGARERNPLVHNIATSGGRTYTPFPISTMPALMYSVDEESVSSGF